MTQSKPHLEQSVEENTKLRKELSRLKEVENELQNLNERLQENEKKYRFLIDNCKEIILILSNKGKITFANEQALKSFGYIQEEIIGKFIGRFLTKKSVAFAMKALVQEFLGNPQPRMEVQIKTKSGEIRHLEIAPGSTPIHEEGRISGVMISAIDITERIKAEENLLFMQFSLNSAADSVFWMSSDAQFFYANDAACQNLGYSRQELLTMTVHDIDPNFPKKAWPDHWKDVKSKGSFTFESNHQKKDGMIFPVEISVNYLEFMGKEYNCAFVRDITERKRIEKELRESEERFKSVFDNTMIGLYRTTPDGQILMVNPTLLKMLAYSSLEDLAKRNLEEGGYAPNYPRSNFKQIMNKQGEIRGLESAWTKKDGSILLISENAKAIRDEKGEIIYFEGTVEDISFRKAAEEKLKNSEELYRELVDKAEIAILIDDTEGSIQFANMKAAELYGYSVEELKNQSIQSLVHPEDFVMVQRFHENRLQGKKAPSKYVFRGIRKDGSIRLVEIDAVPHKKEESVLGTRLYLRDITKQKQMEEEILQSREQLRNLALHLQAVREEERALAAQEIHDELGQSLAALAMDISWLHKKILPEQKELSEKLDNMKRLTTDTIREVKRIYSELRPSLLDDLGLVSAIEWYLEQFRSRTGIECFLEAVPVEFTLAPDRSTAMFRILQQSLINVDKHAEATKVAVSLKQSSNNLELVIKDNGKGIKKEKIDDSRSFGLIEIKERVRDLRGDFKVSGSPGKGTKVKVVIPL